MQAQSPNEAACQLLNELIVACLDEQTMHRAAANLTDASDEANHFRYSAQRRGDFAKELEVEVRALGGSPNANGTFGSWLHALTLTLRGRLFGKNPTAAASACVAVDARVDALYAKAMSAGMPDRARAALARHHAELTVDRENHRQLRARAVRPTTS